MKKGMLIFVGLILIFSFRANTKQLDYKSYRTAIEKAELDIINNNYNAAGLDYLKAFDLNPKPMLKDIYNALIVAIKQKDKQNAFLFANQLAKLGVGKPFFENQFKFNWLKNQGNWDELLRNAQESREMIEKNQSETLLILKRMREKFDNTLKEINPNSENWNQLSLVEDSLSKQLFSLFKEKGYLSPYIIGANIKEDTILTDPIFSPILKWNGLLPNGETSYNGRFDSVLQDALKQGLVDMNFFQENTMSKFNEEISLPSITRIDCMLYEKTYSERQLKEIDSIRLNYGLCNHNDFLIKLRFNATHNKNPFELFPKIPKQKFSKKWIDSVYPNFFEKNSFITVISNCK